jgi:hypothetical protein
MKKEEKTFEIWVEGFATYGESGEAQYLGHNVGNTFQEACENALKDNKWDMSYYNPATNTYWGCSFYDNEQDARKWFG